MDMVERVSRAIDEAGCPNREGPFGGYDYGHNTEFYGPAPEGGRYVIRDFRTLASKGEWLHQTDDRVLHEATLEQMTKGHIAKAAIRAMLEGLEPVASLYTMHMELNQTCDRLDNPGLAPFGIPGRDYSEEYTVTETPLYDLSALKEAVK